MEELISEDLGRGIAVELDPGTGALTLLDSAHGIRLAALQVWQLESFLSERKAVWLEQAAGCVMDAMKGE